MTEIEQMLLQSVRELNEAHTNEMNSLKHFVGGLIEQLKESENGRASLEKQVTNLSKRLDTLTAQIEQLRL